jgi:hypothetical protein
MSTYYIEQRKLAAPSALAVEVAGHLQVRCTVGSATIITDRPAVFLSVLRKRWLKMMRLVQRERASTLNTEKIVALTQLIARMQSLRFAAQSTDQRQEADVSILLPADAASTPLCCRTLYLTVRLANGMLNSLVEQLPRHVVVVDFGENF